MPWRGGFFPVASRVVYADKERRRALNAKASSSELQRNLVLGRIGENIDRIEWVRRSIDRRIRAYNNAIETLEVESPSDLLYETRRSVDYLVACAENADVLPLFGMPPPPAEPAVVRKIARKT